MTSRTMTTRAKQQEGAGDEISEQSYSSILFIAMFYEYI